MFYREIYEFSRTPIFERHQQATASFNCFGSLGKLYAGYILVLKLLAVYAW